MLPNCEHEDCNDCLELAEACAGIRFNNMVMLAQVARIKSWSISSSWSGSVARLTKHCSGYMPRFWSGARAKSWDWYPCSWSGSWYKSKTISGSY